MLILAGDVSRSLLLHDKTSRQHEKREDKMPWLMKAEPDSRIEKGKDVKVSSSNLYFQARNDGNSSL